MAGHRPEAARLLGEGLGAFFRYRDAARLGLSAYSLQRLVARGEVEKIGPGLYRLAEAEPSEMETIAMVAATVPAGIICLLSALRIHGIGTQAPHEVWLGMDRKARKPVRLPARVRIVRFSGPMLTYGVKTQRVLGVPVRVTSPARTVVDCFRYRNKIGLDVAIEALRESLRSRLVTADEILRTADVCRARTVVRPYLEAMAP
ncbi:MAG: type IV toxin-antitoxin system AbiEi family antitoxin domain-containing protein [Limisphaera sp.]|nr:type IV toxin-antitoxin system AbiEi family antitoxin domain-containing protein [Limisphaera sp.]